MSEAALPETWADARKIILVNAPWILLLVSVERAFEGHYYEAGFAFLLCIAALAVAVHWNAFEGHGRSRWLAFILIAIGAICLTAGIYLLATEQRPTSPTAEDIAKIAAPIRAELETVRRDLAATKNELESTKRQLQAARNAPATGPAPELPPAKQGPITWHVDSQLLVVSGGAPNAAVNGVLFMGTSTASVTIKEAYITSGITGRKQELMANVQSRGAYYPVDKVDIPPDAPLQLDAIFNPALPIRDFLDQWAKFRVTIVYNGMTYERDFDEPYVRQKLREHVPNALGPRVTPKDDK